MSTIAPIFASGCSIHTLTPKGIPSDLIIARYVWHESFLDKDKIQRFQPIPIATIVIPRTAAKGMAKQWLGILSVEDEHGGPGGKRR